MLETAELNFTKRKTNVCSTAPFDDQLAKRGNSSDSSLESCRYLRNSYI